jgi:hypothetical protein
MTATTPRSMTHMHFTSANQLNGPAGPWSM